MNFMYGYDTFHDEVMLELINNVHDGLSNQAYIFEGPEGLNILCSAKLFAAALTCLNKKTAPCGECRVCRLSYADSNPDIIYVNTADEKSIGVEKIREMSKDVYIKPFEADYKVYIIEDGNALTEAAQNAMLKILEEPPEYAVFVIITASCETLLPTVLSRCAKVRFTPLSEEQMHSYIEEKYGKTELDTEFLTRFSQGIPKMADDIISDPDFEPIRRQAFKMLVPLLSKHRISAYAVTEFLENNKEKAELILNLWQSFLRDILLMQNDAKALTVNADMNEELSKLASRLPDNCCIIALERLIVAKNMLRRYVNLHVLGLSLSFSIKNSIYSR